MYQKAMIIIPVFEKITAFNINMKIAHKKLQFYV